MPDPTPSADADAEVEVDAPQHEDDADADSSCDHDHAAEDGVRTRTRWHPHGWSDEQWEAKTGGSVKLRYRGLRDIPELLFLVPVKFYQVCIGPFLPSMCRYEPTCSSFMLHAIRQKGLFWGPILGIIRILRCNPFFPGGYDPVEAWWPFPGLKKLKRDAAAADEDAAESTD